MIELIRAAIEWNLPTGVIRTIWVRPHAGYFDVCLFCDRREPVAVRVRSTAALHEVADQLDRAAAILLTGGSDGSSEPSLLQAQLDAAAEAFEAGFSLAVSTT